MGPWSQNSTSAAATTLQKSSSRQTRRRRPTSRTTSSWPVWFLASSLLLLASLNLVLVTRIPYDYYYVEEQELDAWSGQGHRKTLIRMSQEEEENKVYTTRQQVQSPFEDNRNDVCQEKYHRRTSRGRIPLRREVLDRSQLYMGHRGRLAHVIDKLQHHQPIQVLVCGGSITLGHGVATPEAARYAGQFETWLKDHYPLSSSSQQQHSVLVRGAHGANTCAMAQRLHLLLDELHQTVPDIIVLEFAVNDYQGQDHKVLVDSKTEVFFDGFDRLATCAEVVVSTLLSHYPKAALVFLEFQTAVLPRKTAQVLHWGVAHHYQIPVLSYAQAILPDFVQLAQLLQPYNYSLPTASNPTNSAFAHELPALYKALPPFPHGCGPCRTDDISLQFRPHGCRTLCFFMEPKRGGYWQGTCPEHFDTNGSIHNNDNESSTTSSQMLEPCHVPLFAHDAVHPSAVGHAVAAQLLGEWMARTAHQLCRGQISLEDPVPVVPSRTWMGSREEDSDTNEETDRVMDSSSVSVLQARHRFVLVNDTMPLFANPHRLAAVQHSSGFACQAGRHPADRVGWMATNPKGNEFVTFEINVPRAPCYVIVLSILRSYETVGLFSIQTVDLATNRTTTTPITTALWKPRISIPAEFAATTDDDRYACTGHCRITVRTHPRRRHRHRPSNHSSSSNDPPKHWSKVKIMSLAVRPCVATTHSKTKKRAGGDAAGGRHPFNETPSLGTSPNIY